MASVAEESVAYVLFLTPVMIVLATIACIPIVLTAPFAGIRRGLHRVRNVYLFACFLYVSGYFGNLIFTAACRDRLYVTFDPIVDWVPFFPSMDWTLDPACHGHLLDGMTPAGFYAAWIAIAVPVWLTTIAAFRRVVGTSASPTTSD